MRKRYLWLALVLLLTPLLALSSGAGASQTPAALAGCKDFAYSTEEDFLTQGPLPPDGNPVISDGDLLNQFHEVCLRNRELLQQWDLDLDLGLDAADVLDIDGHLVAFSTELDHPGGRFTAGDLLTTWGAEIPNEALLVLFQVQGDRGLDAVHFIGAKPRILAFNEFARSIPRDEWLRNSGQLVNALQEFNIDIWFSIEGTERQASVVAIYDGDILSARNGTIILRNSDLFDASVPAGLPDRGVDFGVDAFTARRDKTRKDARFSTEILYRGEMMFTDGDILQFLAPGHTIAITDKNLYAPFEPRADFLGTDALYVFYEEPLEVYDYLPVILRMFRGGGS